MSTFKPSAGAPVSAAWASSVERRLDETRQRGLGVTIGPSGRTVRLPEAVRLGVRPDRQPWAVYLCHDQYDNWTVRVWPGRISMGTEDLTVELGEGWTEAEEVIDPVAGKTSPLRKYYTHALPVDGAEMEVNLVVTDAAATLELSAEAAIPGAICLAQLFNPSTVASGGTELQPERPGGRVIQRIIGDITMGGGGGGTQLGRIESGENGVYSVTLLPSGETATLVATEVAASATLPPGSIVICHAIAMPTTPLRDL